jgi:Amt family ammonium transporter
MTGMLLTGIFANKLVHGIASGPQGLAYGNPAFFWTQCKAMAIVAVYSFTVSLLIFRFINSLLPIRVSEKEEDEGLDATQHNEQYVQGTLLVKTMDLLEEQKVR